MIALMNPSKPITSLDRRLLQESKAAKPFLLANLLFNTLASLLLIGQAFVLSQIINHAYQDTTPLEQLIPDFLLLITVLMLRATAIYLSAKTAFQMSQVFRDNLQERFVRHLYRLGLPFLNKERSGELVLAATTGIEKLDAYYREYLPSLFTALILPALILLLVFPLDWITFLILLVTAPLIPFFMALIGMAAGRLAQEQFGTMRLLSAHFLDVMQGLTTLKLFNRSQYQSTSIQGITEEFRQATMRVLRVAFLSALSLEILATLSVAIIAVEIGVRLLYGIITFEQALFLLVIAPEFYLPLRTLGAKFHNATESKAAAARVFEILDMPVTDESELALQKSVKWGTIRFENVSFAYDESRSALRNISFSIVLGQRIALVGKSGSGKTTIAQLLLGFIRPTSGRILIGDNDMAEISLEEWRKQVSWLGQSPFIFNTTVAENIRLSRPDASQLEIEAAAKMAGADDFIRDLPEAYETLLGEKGLRLSGGQVQRIALARALLRDAPLLILDEPSSQLDSKHETEIMQRILAPCANRAVLLLTHRLQTVEEADWIIVLDEGQIVEAGRPEDLLQGDGFYRQLLLKDGAKDEA